MDCASVFSRLKASLSTSSIRGLRICESSDLKDKFRSGKRKDEVESLCSKILKMYDLALPVVEDMGNGSCSCLGLLDPVTNIQLNYLLGCLVLPPEPGVQADTMAHRSLDGLIAFLTCLFPYLPDREALAYIDAAAADPLVAALLVINRRSLTVDSFITASSVEIALRTAAVAAKHPDPEAFMRGWKLASPFLEKWATDLDTANVGFFLSLFRRGPSVDYFQPEDYSWKMAEARLTPGILKGAGRLPCARGALKRMLLSIIHGYYLKALAILPKQELTERYHPSLLIGGHCYGPLDPVSNIIVNTVWYEQNFPPAVQVQPLNMISTDCLWRIAARSLYGLVSFLCNRNRNLTPDQALHHLLVARANLTVADPQHLSDHGAKKTGRATIFEAYFAAAQSAKHPSPNLQAEFLGEPQSARNLHTISETLSLSVRDGCTLTKESFGCLHMALRSASSVGFPQHESKDPEKISTESYLEFCSAKKWFWLKHERVTRMVEAALHNFNETAVHKYKLHVICGVNELVKQEFSLDPEVEAYNPWTPYKYHYSHINFLATCQGSPVPKLFFAECSNHSPGTYWCVPVLLHPDAGISLEASPDVGMRPEAARCIYCEHEIGRIWHPITHKFNGRDDFKLTGDNYYSNDNVLLAQGHRADWVHYVEDYAIYENFCDGGYEDFGIAEDSEMGVL